MSPIKPTGMNAGKKLTSKTSPKTVDVFEIHVRIIILLNTAARTFLFVFGDNTYYYSPQ